MLDTLAAAVAGIKGDSSPQQAAGTAAATGVEVILSTLALATHAAEQRS